MESSVDLSNPVSPKDGNLSTHETKHIICNKIIIKFPISYKIIIICMLVKYSIRFFIYMISWNFKWKDIKKSSSRAFYGRALGLYDNCHFD